MSWLRIDDGFDSHPKILALGSDQRRWTWTRILIYTCRYRSPVVPPSIGESIPKATKAFLEDCISLGLVDVDENGIKTVHDWKIYNAQTIEDKVIAYLESDPDASANDVHRAIGGKREIVLAVVRQFQNGSQSVPEPVPPPVPGNRKSGSLSGSLGGTESVHARAHPAQTPIEPAATTTSEVDAAAALLEAGWNERQVSQAAADQGRALALLHAAQADPTCTSPGALAWTKFTNGDTITEPPKPRTCPECGVVIRPPTTLTDHLWQAHDIEHAGAVA